MSESEEPWSESSEENSEDNGDYDSQSSSESANTSSESDSEGLGIVPYNYEPSSSDSSAVEVQDSEDSTSDSESDRFLNTSWYANKLYVTIACLFYATNLGVIVEIVLSCLLMTNVFAVQKSTKLLKKLMISVIPM